MNIQIRKSHLNEIVKTSASAEKIAEALSLCGPSVEKLTKKANDYIFDFEITTNRNDTASVLGIAREMVAILPEFGASASLLPMKLYVPEPQKSLPLIIKENRKLVNRISGFIVENIGNWDTPKWMIERLETAGVRSKNLIVDITNYVMVEIGHPMHAFDYDKIKNATIKVLESKKGEEIITFDSKKYKLPGSDIIFKDIGGKIIDLPGIIGTQNSVVSENTKRVLFFIDNNDPKKIRATSMKLGIRTVAAQINEKGVDPEIGELAIKRAAYLVKSLASVDFASKIYDFYPNKPKSEEIEIDTNFINKKLGTNIDLDKILSILKRLSFDVKEKSGVIYVTPPSYRTQDIKIKEDIVEEIARIYGYHKLPSVLMQGPLPARIKNSSFNFEDRIKNFLAFAEGIETYTLSLVSQKNEKSMALSNELGKDTKYLRTNLVDSLVNVANQNYKKDLAFHIFEIANVYLKEKNGELPLEKQTLAGIFVNTNYKKAKGIIESLLDYLNIEFEVKVSEKKLFQAGKHIEIISDFNKLGNFGVLETNNYIYYEFDIETLLKISRTYKKFIEPGKYPPQIEDVTIEIPKSIYVSEILKTIYNSGKLVKNVEIKDVYKRNFTFRISYQSFLKTLTDSEVENARKTMITRLKNKFPVVIKD